jgi:hypothetical protein
MSSELERRLERLLAEAGEPDPGAGEKALHRSLRALQPVAPPRRGLRAAVVVCAAAVLLLVIAAGSLAAAGALHVSLGSQAKVPSEPTQLRLPAGADGVAAVVGGRLSVVTRAGFRLQGLPTGAAALSPHALFVAAGVGDSLVAMAPDGRRAWSHPAGGRVAAIAWAPDGLRIAYVVQAGRRFALHVIYGNGLHDSTVDRSVRAVRPSWRADSLALAYVGTGGKAIVYDFGYRKHTLAGTAAPVTRLAFAPVGRKLLVGTADSAILAGKRVTAGNIEAIGWLYGRPAAALGMGTTARIRSFGHAGRRLDNFVVPGRVLALTGGLVVTQTSGEVPGWAADRVLAGWGRQKTVETLLRVRPTTSVEDVATG